MKIRLEDGTGLDLKYLVKDTDRHGNVRIYVRRHGRKVRVRELATVEEFMAAYRAACSDDVASTSLKQNAPGPGSLGWLVQTYLRLPGIPGAARKHPNQAPGHPGWHHCSEVQPLALRGIEN